MNRKNEQGSRSGILEQCRRVAKLVDDLGREEAFLQIQSAVPTLTRATLDHMLRFHLHPEAATAEELLKVFRKNRLFAVN